ncbi:nascent polypeptide-associated complex subunit alpha, muscle-specific form-like [Ylistrum balloti]|uniref:nascent polypeptide-associated complex subunit alpha, muscle-specific form-like n=1 Tax=Ylistrum balloti TaxID=509963 RepID=UPI002905E01F|nr:nascent polypeptide-associated complex subunit alpha, muscle-specific form-like [Ylistrum balloti]
MDYVDNKTIRITATEFKKRQRQNIKKANNECHQRQQLKELLLAVIVVVSQAQSQKPSPRLSSPKLSKGRPSGRVGRLSQGSVPRPATVTTRKPSGSKVSPAAGPKVRPAGPKPTARKAPVSPTPSGTPKTKCKGRCKFPQEVCVRKARCQGPSCFFCAETKSIPSLPGKKAAPTPSSPVNLGFSGMGMNNMEMFSMPQQRQQPTDIFSELFGLGPSTGGYDIFGSRQSQMSRQPVPSGYPNSFYPPNPLTSIPVPGQYDTTFSQMDFPKPFSSGNSKPSGGSMTDSNSPPFLRGSPQTPASMPPPMLQPYNFMRESPAMDRSSGLSNLFGGLFGSGSGGMGGTTGMNLLSMSMLGMDPFQLF